MQSDAPILLIDRCGGSCLALLGRTLEERGHRTVLAQTGEEALERVVSHQPKLVVCDMTLRYGVKSYDVMREARELSIHEYLPVLALFQESEVPPKALIALECGADAYILHPVNPDVVAAHIEQILWRRGQRLISRIRLQGGVEVDFESKSVERAGTALELTPTQFEILGLLAHHPGVFVPYDTILKKVWGPEYVDDVAYLRSWVGKIRKRVGDSVIETSRDFGYRVVADS